MSRIGTNSKLTRRIALAALIVAAIAGFIVFRGIGRWLVVSDPLEHSGAIVVLSGGLPYRAVEAAKIYQAGMAPEVWLTKPAPPQLAQLGIVYKGEEQYNQEILLREGVPASAIRILPPDIVNTQEEVRAVIDEMKRSAASRVIFVTSPPHTRRTRALWQELAPQELQSIVRPALEDPYDANHWWRTTNDALSVTREVLGLINVWTGLRVRPGAH
ncbi:MAG: YdcF family protein [Candidatus Acidiferrales bacterium]